MLDLDAHAIDQFVKTCTIEPLRDLGFSEKCASTQGGFKRDICRMGSSDHLNSMQYSNICGSVKTPL